MVVSVADLSDVVSAGGGCSQLFPAHIDSSFISGLVADSQSSDEDKFAAREKLQKLPRDANPIRLQRRCQITGRPHAVYRKFGLSRNKLRELAMRGDVPGLVKSSW